MTFFEYAEKLELIKYLAIHRRTGSAPHLAKKLNISERTLQRMVQQLRDHGYPISFNRTLNCYEVNLHEES